MTGGSQASTDPVQLAARLHYQDRAPRAAPHYDPEREHEAVPTPRRKHVLAGLPDLTFSLIC